MEQEKENMQSMMRHSMSHVMAKAIRNLFGDVKFAIGPSIDHGFYYDMDLEHVITPEDFEAIEKEMNKILSNNEDFVRKEVSKEEALQLFKDQPYKLELINDLPADETISIYYLGEDWHDLCRGPHVENTKYLRQFAFKFNRVSGAYWRGSEKNKMLQRVYVYGFSDKKDLKEYLHLLEEAEKRDHRKLGKELGIFDMFEYGPGFPFMLPKGMEIMNTLIEYWRQVHRRYGYVEIRTPIMLNRTLWETSGHWDHYRENMYTTTIDEEDFAVKPMNCPGGMLVYGSQIHSYKDLPLRIGELGLVHRHELSGALHGLMRVREFTQDDAHIFMTEDQIEDEILNVVHLFDEVYNTFGLTYEVELSTRPENSMGSDEQWEKATKGLEGALKRIGKSYVINEGDGAFYGPKIDFHLKDCLGRTWQCGTIQLDMQLPERFDLSYIGADGEKHRPVMVHRVVYGSIERFIGILIEHFGGSFPTWLAPVQVKVMGIADSHIPYMQSIKAQLENEGIRVELDDRNEKIGKKIRDAQVAKVPYMLVIGDKEQEEQLVAVRHRKEGDKGTMTLQVFVDLIKQEIKEKTIK